MSKQVEFYYDFGSPYSYLAFCHLPKVAEKTGAEIVWRPMLLGGVFQATHNASPMEVPAKASHLQADLRRWAAYFDVPFEMNPFFPINTLALMRGATALQMKGDEEAFDRYNAAIYAAMFETPKNLNQPEEIGKVLHAAGFDPAQVLAMVNDQAVKDKLKVDTTAAVMRGVFGAPTFFVGDQMFWGQDRLHFVEQALM